MKKYIVYYDQRLAVEVKAYDEECAKELAKELVACELSIQGDQVKADGLEFGEIEEQTLDPVDMEEQDDLIQATEYFHKGEK